MATDFQELAEIGTWTIYDLEDGGRPLKRPPVSAKEILRLGGGRYVQSRPTPEDCEAWRNRKAQLVVLDGGLQEPGPAPRPLAQAGAPLEPSPYIRDKPMGHTLTGLIADAILKMDPATDFNRDGTPDRRKLAGLIRAHNVDRNDVEAALRLLGWQEPEEDGGEWVRPAPDGEDEPDAPPATDED